MEKAMHGFVQASKTRWHSLAQSQRRRLIAAVVTFMLVVLYWQQLVQSPWKNKEVLLTDHDGNTSLVVGSESFEIIPMSGYANTNIPDGPNCDDIRVKEQQIQVTNSTYLEDDLLVMAENLNHPMIDYTTQPTGLSFKEQLRRTWARMAGSSVWLEEHQVYFTVSRVFFYTKGVKHWPIISFIRAQVYDEKWNHLDKYVLEWKGQNFTYPQILDIPSYFKKGSGYYGPEDPRIIIETGITDAEPVIIFNVVDESETRSMNIYRPFSNFTTRLRIENEAALLAEKNWSPFIMPQVDASRRVHQLYPSTHIHFVYSFYPLKVLRCHLMNGFCQWAYKQDQRGVEWEAYKKNRQYPDAKSVMRGGTNFLPVPYEHRPGLTSFIGLPRTHTVAGCGKQYGLYRPVIMLLTTNGTHYWLDYSSDYLNFGHSVLTPDQLKDPCDTGRILLANGLARYEHEEKRDIMTVLFTVADSTVQVARIHGIRKLIQSLPQMQTDQIVTELEQSIPSRLNVTYDVLSCAVNSASDYAINNTPSSQNR